MEIETMHEVVTPVSLVSFLWNKVGIVISPGDVNKYWSHAVEVQAPWAINHPSISEGTSDCVPMRIFHDECKYGQDQSEKTMGIWITFPLRRPRSTRASGFLVWSCRNCRSLGNKTVYPVLRFLTWQINALYFGVHPRAGYMQPLTQREQELAGKDVVEGGWKRFAVTEFGGDWKGHKVGHI